MVDTKGRERLWLGVIVASAVIFRLYSIRHYAWYIDEGFWSYGSAMAVKHGIWWPYGWRFGYMSPFFTRLLYPVFLVFGPSIQVARYFSVILGVASVFSIYFVCARLGYNRNICLLSALFLSLDGFFAESNRFALTDNPLTLLLIWLMLVLAGRRRNFAVGPVLLGLAILSKMTAVFAGATAYFYDVLVTYQNQPIWKKYLKSAVLPAAGFLLAAVVFGALYVTHPAGFTSAWHRELAVRHKGSGFLSGTDFKQSALALGRSMPFLSIFGIIGFVDMLRNRSKHVLILLWLICGAAVIVPQHYQAARYYMPLIPPLCVTAAWLIDTRLLTHRKNLVRIAGIAAVGFLCIYGPATWYVHQARHGDTSGPDIVRWMNQNLTPDTGVMGAIDYGCTANVRYYPQDIYCPNTFLTDREIARLHISYILFDDAEWRHWSRILHSGFESQLPKRFDFVKRIGRVEIWKVKASDTKQANQRTTLPR